MRLRARCMSYSVVCACLCVIAYLLLNEFDEGADSEETEAVTEDPVMAFREARFVKAQNRPPREGPGEKGVGVVLTAEEKVIADKLFPDASFNVYASDKIAMDRSIPDTRIAECRDIEYPADLPTVSVVLIFNNEALSVVLRTVHSIVNRTPPRYLHEIILLDDCSDHEELLDNLDKIVAVTWPDGIVKIVRRETRGGLVRARVSGARAATGDVLLVMDAHMEVNVHWAEPILSYIKEHPNSLVLPVTDAIRDQDMKYTGGPGSGIQGFTWSMLFSWMDAPARLKLEQNKRTDPVKSFAMVGCVFAIQREYFFHMGAFDEGMGIWGAENVELPLRIWMCGGSVYMLPCSRIGHLYRKTHPFTFPEKDVMGYNAKRLVEVWLDDYKRLFYRHRPTLVDRDVGDLSERKALRERLNCHSFKWFLQNIYIEKFVPDENVRAFGLVANKQTGLCVDPLGQKLKDPFKLGLANCRPGHINQEMSLSMTNEFRMELMCFDKSKIGNVVMASKCKGQRWYYNKVDQTLVHEKTMLCMDATGKKAREYVELNPCNGSPGQQWEWTKLFS